MLVAPLYLKLREAKEKIIVCQGGGDAAKTVTILQRLCEKNVNKKAQISDVIQETVPAIKAGSLTTFQRYVLPTYGKYIRSFNASDRVYYFYNGSRLGFKSFRDEASATGAERDNIFFNEGNHETYDTFWQAQRKTRGQVFIDYNPNAPFWVHSRVLPYTIEGLPNPDQEGEFKRKGVKLFITDHRHNPFLSEEDHFAYESISDADLWKVYARGRTGKVKGLIFGHFKKWTATDFPEDAVRIVWAIDYGYTNDPTALVKIYVGPGRRRVAVECSYEPGLSPQKIKDLLFLNGWKSPQPIYSEADPNMINDLRMLGMPVEPAIKGPGSLIAGISKVKEYECYYAGENFEKEIFSWKWIEAQDIMTGKTVMTNQPTDAWNHCCDATRMGIYTDYFRHKGQS